MGDEVVGAESHDQIEVLLRGLRKHHADQQGLDRGRVREPFVRPVLDHTTRTSVEGIDAQSGVELLLEVRERLRSRRKRLWRSGRLGRRAARGAHSGRIPTIAGA